LVTGDVRVNVIPSLGAMQTLLVREHNRIASELQSRNSQWDTEKIFQETLKCGHSENVYLTMNGFHW